MGGWAVRGMIQWNMSISLYEQWPIWNRQIYRSTGAERGAGFMCTHVMRGARGAGCMGSAERDVGRVFLQLFGNEGLECERIDPFWHVFNRKGLQTRVNDSQREILGNGYEIGRNLPNTILPLHDMPWLIHLRQPREAFQGGWWAEKQWEQLEKTWSSRVNGKKIYSGWSHDTGSIFLYCVLFIFICFSITTLTHGGEGRRARGGGMWYAGHVAFPSHVHHVYLHTHTYAHHMHVHAHTHMHTRVLLHSN